MPQVDNLDTPEKATGCTSTINSDRATKLQEYEVPEKDSGSRQSSPERAVKQCEDPFARNELLIIDDIFPNNLLAHKISPEHEGFDKSAEVSVMATCSTPLMECMPYDESDLSIPMNLLEDDSDQSTFDSK